MFNITDCFNAISDNYCVVVDRSGQYIVLEWEQFFILVRVTDSIHDGYYTIKEKNDPSVKYDKYGTYKNQCKCILDFNTIICVTDLHIKFEYKPDYNVLKLNCTKDEYFHYCLYNDTPFKFEELPLFEELYHLVQRKYFNEEP